MMRMLVGVAVFTACATVIDSMPAHATSLNVGPDVRPVYRTRPTVAPRPASRPSVRSYQGRSGGVNFGAAAAGGAILGTILSNLPAGSSSSPVEVPQADTSRQLPADRAIPSAGKNAAQRKYDACLQVMGQPGSSRCFKQAATMFYRAGDEMMTRIAGETAMRAAQAEQQADPRITYTPAAGAPLQGGQEVAGLGEAYESAKTSTKKMINRGAKLGLRALKKMDELEKGVSASNPGNVYPYAGNAVMDEANRKAEHAVIKPPPD